MACVTRMRVFLANFFMKTDLKIFFFTFASRAEMGSSMRMRSLSA